jgi:hypothetical protein
MKDCWQESRNGMIEIDIRDELTVEEWREIVCSNRVKERYTYSKASWGTSTDLNMLWLAAEYLTRISLRELSSDPGAGLGFQQASQHSEVELTMRFTEGLA